MVLGLKEVNDRHLSVTSLSTLHTIGKEINWK